MDDVEQLRIDYSSVKEGLNGDLVMMSAVFTVGSDDDLCGHCYLDNLLDQSFRHNTGSSPLYTAYIAEALPPRAPSVTV